MLAWSNDVIFNVESCVIFSVKKFVMTSPNKDGDLNLVTFILFLIFVTYQNKVSECESRS